MIIDFIEHAYADTSTLTKSTLANSIVDSSCKNCLIYIITGSVVGIVILLVICALLIAVVIRIIHSNKNSGLNRDYGTTESPVYECIPVYGHLNPTLTSVMTENEAYNTCCDEIRAYDVL